MYATCATHPVFLPLVTAIQIKMADGITLGEECEL
jgi:hypothetical protein